MGDDVLPRSDDASSGRLAESGGFRRVVVVAIVLVAAALRLTAVGFGDKSLSVQPDEAFYNVSLPLDLSWTSLNPHRFYYPDLFWYALSAIDHLSLWIEDGLGFLHARSLREVFDANPIPFFVLGRALNAMVGTATVWLLVLFGRRVGREPQGWIAAVLLAVAFLHVRDSALATVEAPTTLFVVLSLVGAGGVLHEDRRRHYVIAGLGAGLAASSKYNGALVILPVLLAHLLRGASAGQPPRRRLLSPLPYEAALLAAAAFFVLNPYFVLDWSEARADLAGELAHQRTGQYADLGPAWWYHLSVSLRYGMGALPLGLAVLGIGLAVWRRDRDGFVLLAFALPLYATFSASHAIFVRYMTPLVPVFCWFAAQAILEIAGRRMPRRAEVALVFTVVATAAAEPLFSSLAYGELARTTDTRVQAYEFVRSSLPPHSAVATYGPAVVWKSTMPGFGEHIVHCHPGPGENWADELQTLKRRHVEYFLTHHSELDVFSPTIPDLESALARSATLVAEFPFFRDKDAVPHPIYDEVDGFYFPIGRFRGVKRPGPLVRLYRLD